MREFLERNYTADMSQAEAAKLSVKALLEVVQTGAKNIEIAVITKNQKPKTLTLEDVDAIVKEISDEKEAEAQRKKDRAAGRAAAAASAISTVAAATTEESDTVPMETDASS